MGEKELKGMEMWIPEKEGDELKGEVIAINTEGDYGNQYMIKKDDGEETLTPSHKVLQSRLRPVKVGDKVRIVYKGEEAPAVKGHNATKMYEAFLLE